MKKKYILNGKIYDEDVMNQYAQKSGLSFGDYLNESGAKEFNDTNTYSLNGKEYDGNTLASFAQKSNIGFDDYLKEAGAKKKELAQNGSENSGGFFTGVALQNAGKNFPSSLETQVGAFKRRPDTQDDTQSQQFDNGAKETSLDEARKAGGVAIFKRANKIQAPNGISLDIVNYPPEVGTHSFNVGISKLQQGINSGTVSPDDVALVSTMTKKNPQAVSAYLKGDTEIGASIDRVDFMKKNHDDLVNIVNTFNQDFGDTKNPDEILSSADATAKFLDEYQRRLATSDPLKAKMLQMEQQGHDVDMANINAMVESDASLKESIDKYQSILSGLTPNVERLKSAVLKKTTEEEYAKGTPRTEIAKIIAQRLNPGEYANAVNAMQSDSWTHLPTMQAAGALSAGIGMLSEGPVSKSEILNSVVGQADIMLNDAYRNMALDKMAQGKLDKNDSLIDEAKNINLLVDKNIEDKYPAIQLQNMAREIGYDIAKQSGQLKVSSSAETMKSLMSIEKVIGPTSDAIAALVKQKGWLDDEKKRAMAIQLIMHPEMVQDASVFGGLKDSFLQPFKDLGLSLADVTGLRTFKDRYADKMKDDMFPKEFTPEETNADFTILGHDMRIRSVANGISNLAGLTAASYLTGTVGTSQGLSVNAAERLGAYTSFAIPSIDQNLKDSYNFIDDDAHRAAYVLLGALINGEGGAFLNLGKLSAVPGLAEDFTKLSQNLVEKNMTNSATNEVLNRAKNKYVDYVTKYGKVAANIAREDLKGAATMAYFSFANSYNKLLFGGEQPGQDMIKESGTAFLDGIFNMMPFAFVHGVGASPNSTYKETINKLSVMPDAAQDAVRIGSKSEADFNYKMSVINTAKAARNALETAQKDLGVTLLPSQQSVYVANKTIEATLREKASKTVDETQKEKYLKDADEVASETSKIFDGLRFSPTLEPLWGLYYAEKEYTKAYDDFHSGRVKEDKDLLAAQDKFEKEQYKYFESGPRVEQEKIWIDGKRASKLDLQQIMAKGQKEVDKYDIEYEGPDDAMHTALQKLGGATEDNYSLSPKSREVVLEEQASGIFDRLQGKLPPRMLDPLNKAQSIYELTNQALTAPAGVHSALGYDEKMTAELVARNTTEDILNFIKKWEDEAAKEGVTDFEVKHADRNIRLLEKGLEFKDRQNVRESINKKVELLSNEQAGKNFEQLKEIVSNNREQSLKQIEENDTENQTGVRRTIGEGETPIQDESIKGRSGKEAETSGMVQKSQEEVDTRTPEEVEAQEQDYQQRVKSVTDYVKQHNITLTDEQVDHAAALISEGEDVKEVIDHVKEQQGDIDVAQPIIDRISKGERINEKEIEPARDVLYKILDAHPEAQHLIEPLITKLEQYENTTETQNRTVTEEVPVETASRTEQPPVSKSIKQWEGNRAEIIDRNGHSTEGIIREENGKYYLYNSRGNKVAVIGDTTIADRDISLPSKEDVPMPITIDRKGDVDTITLQLNRIDEQHGGMEPDKLVKIHFTDKEKALDYAIALRAEEIGTIPDAYLEKQFEKVDKQVQQEVLKKGQYSLNLTPATLRESVPEIKKMYEKAKSLFDDGKHEEANRLYEQMLSKGEAAIKESVKNIDGVELKLAKTKGNYFGGEEPTFTGELIINNPKSAQEVFDKIADFAEAYSQESVHISKVMDALPPGAELGKVNPDGSVYEPNVEIRFEKPLSGQEYRELSTVIQSVGGQGNELAGSTLHPDKKGITLYNISKFKDHDTFQQQVGQLVKKLHDDGGFQPSVTTSVRQLWNYGESEGAGGATRTYEQLREGYLPHTITPEEKSGAYNKSTDGTNNSGLNEGQGGKPGTSNVGSQPTHVNNSITTQEFFSSTVNGANQPKTSWKPLLALDGALKKVYDVWQKFRGGFDSHIETNIPAFRDVQIKKINAIADTLPEGGLVIDLGGSEGGFGKTLTEINPKIKTINLDMNPDMETAHNRNPVEGADFVKAAFGEDVPLEDGTVVKRYQPKEKADVVHESMMFQFIAPERKGFIDEIADHYVKDDGVVILEEKIKAENWSANESKKDDEFKSEYYDSDAIKKKNEEVVVGMKGNQAEEADLLKGLSSRFKYVYQYWDSGNFKGYIASNDAAKAKQMLDAIGDTTSPYTSREKLVSIEDGIISNQPDYLGGKTTPPKSPQSAQSSGGGKPGTHINKSDITSAQDLAKSFPIQGGRVFWGESVDAGIEKLKNEAKPGETLIDVANRKIADWGSLIQRELLAKGKSTFNPSDEELAIMSYYRTHLNDRLTALAPALESESLDVRNNALAEARNIQDKIEGVDYVLSESGKVAGRSFYIRQAVSMMDASNRMTVRRMDIMRAQNGRQLTPQQEQAIAATVARERKLDLAAAKMEQYSQEDFEKAVNAEVERRMKEKKINKSDSASVRKEKTLKQTGAEWADRIQKLKIKADPNTLQSSIVGLGVAGYNKLVDLISGLVRGGATIADAIGQALKDPGFSSLDKDEVISHFVGGMEKQDVLDKITELAKEEKTGGLTVSAVEKGLVNNLVNIYADSGLRGKEIFDALKKDLTDVFPIMSDQEIRDAYLKTGNYKIPKKEELNKKRTDAKNDLKNIISLEERIKQAKEGVVGAKNETQRRKYSDQELKLREELASELNKRGLKYERAPKEEYELKKKEAEQHNARVDELLSKVNDEISKAESDEEKAQLRKVANHLDMSKVDESSAEKVDNAINRGLGELRKAAVESIGTDLSFNISDAASKATKGLNDAMQDILLQRYKRTLEGRITQAQNKLEAGEYDTQEKPIRLKTDAEAIRLEIEMRTIEGEYKRQQYLAEQSTKATYEKALSLGQAFLVNELIGGIKTAGVVLSSGITKQPLNTITNATFGRLAHWINPTLSRAAGAEAPITLRQEKNRYMAHYGKIGPQGMENIVTRAADKMSAAKSDYESAKEKYGDAEKGTKEYSALTKAKNKYMESLLNHQSLYLFKWIGSNAWRDANKLFLEGANQLDEMTGKQRPVEWSEMTGTEKTEFLMGMMGSLHGYFKNFSARAEFAAGFTARLEQMSRRGEDITDPATIISAINQSLFNYNAGKYQEDNFATSAMNRIGKMLEEMAIEPSRQGADRNPKNEVLGKSLAAVYKAKYPIVRTGVNIGREAIIEYCLGPMVGAIFQGAEVTKGVVKSIRENKKLNDAIREQVMSMSPDKVDLIFRCYRKGGVGLVMAALATLGYIRFGGFYGDEDWRRKPGELKIGDLEVFGVNLGHGIWSKMFTHSAATMPALMVSNAREVYDRKYKSMIRNGKPDAVKEATQAALMSDLMAGLRIIPIFNNSFQNPVMNFSVPYGRAAADVSEWFDTDKNGHVIQRDRSTWWNRFKINTGFRSTVPEKNH